MSSLLVMWNINSLLPEMSKEMSDSLKPFTVITVTSVGHFARNVFKKCT